MAFLAIAGITLNIAIGRYYGPADLGIFNIVFALFIFFSQLGSFGLQYSTLRFASLTRDGAELKLIFGSAFKLVLLTSTATVGVALLATPLLSAMFDLGGSARAWLLALPGLWCFSINKVLLAFLNGIGSMRAFAMFQSCRYFLLMVSLLLAILFGVAGPDIAVILTVAEATLLLLLTAYFFPSLRRSPFGADAVWRKQHLKFGALAMPSGVMAELNTRVDILLLGAILGSFQTGVYSIAIMLAEGFGQIVFVVRNVVNPLLGPIVEQRDQAALSALVRRVGGATLGMMVAGGMLLLIIFPYFDEIFLRSRFGEAFWPLVILVIGLIATAPLMIFVMILNQGGRPGIYTTLMISILASNIVFNLVGVYAWGITGAALGTALSYLVGGVTLDLFCRRVFGLRLWIA